jgi:hypothetical protein
LAGFVATLVWDYVSRDFWEVVPVVPCAIVTGVFAAATGFSWQRRVLFAVLVGLVIGFATFVVALLVAMGRWGA